MFKYSIDEAGRSIALDTVSLFVILEKSKPKPGLLLWILRTMSWWITWTKMSKIRPQKRVQQRPQKRVQQRPQQQ